MDHARGKTNMCNKIVLIDNEFALNLQLFHLLNSVITFRFNCFIEPLTKRNIILVAL